MRSYNVNLELFDDAIFREYRILERFFDIDLAIEFRLCFKEIRNKILKNTATKDELLQVAELIKKHCE